MTQQVSVLGWDDLDLDVQVILPILPISHQSWQRWADSGTAKIKVNPTQVRDLLNHPVDRYMEDSRANFLSSQALGAFSHSLWVTTFLAGS